MTSTTVMTPSSRRTPWHLWAVSAVSLLWNSFGAFDYSMSHLQGDAYYRAGGMTEAQIAHMHQSPGWMELFWALGVWGAVIGSVLLLLRSRWAVGALAASLAGALVSLLYQAVIAPMPGAGGAVALPLAIAVVAALLAGYAWAMRRRGVLR